MVLIQLSKITIQVSKMQCRENFYGFTFIIKNTLNK